MKKSHLGLLFVSISPVLSLVHGCAGELDNPSSFVDASFFNTGGGGGAGGTGGSGAGTGGSGGSGTTNCPDQAMFLQTTCGISTCHGSPVQVGLDLTKIGTGQQYIGAAPTGACAGHPLIDPNNAQNSLLYLILQNMPPRPCGLQMPFLQSPFSQTQQACVLEWVQGVLASGGGGGGGSADAGADASSGAGGSSGTGGSMGAGGSAGGAGR